MKSSEGKPFIYEKPQLIEVICQLRYPVILSIDTKEPADFQDEIRAKFPRYSCQTEKLPLADGKQQSIRNHNFISEDGVYKLSMTKQFIALSTMRYSGWEHFARTLDEALWQFIRVYRPAYFERVGLRYINGISRRLLGLEDRRWNDLLQPQYLSILDDDAVDEQRVTKCSVDIERRLDGKAGLKLHAGPGMVQRTVRTPEGVRNLKEPDSRFILDQDLYVAEKTQLSEVTETLEALHEHADRIFTDAITDTLHDAMEPREL